MIKLILLLTSIAQAQSVNVDKVRFYPAALPSSCVTGEVRIDSADSYKLSICKLGSWIDVVDASTFTNPMTTNGDFITQAAGVPARIALGSANTVMTSNGTTPSWQTNFTAGTITAALVGNSSTATALASDPSDCASNTYATTIAASGNLTCASITNASTTGTAANTVSTLVLRDSSGNFAAGTITASLTGNVTGNVTGNADTATALAANPADCASDTYATAINASGTLSCGTVTNAGLAGSIAVSKLVAQTASRIALTDASGFLTTADTTTYPSLTELSYVKGVTSAVQTQINTKAPSASPTFTGTVTGPYTTAGPVITTSGGVTSSEAQLALSRGGTNKNMTAAAGALVFTDADSLEVMSAGTAGQVPRSAGSGTPTWGTDILGSSTNDSAAAGYKGELLSASLQSGSAVSLSSGTAKTVTSVSLTAGDWDVWGFIAINPGGDITRVSGSVGPTNDTITATEPILGGFYQLSLVSGAHGNQRFGIPQIRISLASTTTYYLVATCTFSTSTCTAFGSIMARRAR